ncbi:MAG: 4-(cytidine 5'-diphospho)-2-C-methyl-D-erythritol kinase [Elusimicrobiota bacterium]
MKLKANAKINLFLEVLNKRKDGYHNIRTVFQEISLADDIFITEKRETDAKQHAKQTRNNNMIKICCDNPEIPTDKKNLVYKAAMLLKKQFNIKKGVEIKIKKRIPVGAGLGGGSSDAAAVLKGLNRLWELNLTKTQFIKIAKQIGADVPFFVLGGRCFGEGIGDKLTPLKIKKKEWYVMVKPQFDISTKSAYSLLTKSQKISKINKLGNRLEDVIIRHYPEIKKIKEKLIKYGAEFSLMSGSGSGVFGIVRNKKEGNEIKNQLKKDGYTVWLVHTVKAGKRQVKG